MSQIKLWGDRGPPTGSASM